MNSRSLLEDLSLSFAQRSFRLCFFCFSLGTCCIGYCLFCFSNGLFGFGFGLGRFKLRLLSSLVS